MNGVDGCDLCGAVGLTPVYQAETTQRGLTVYVCSVCGLVQSLPRIDHVDTHTPAASSDADWGYLRYGKQFSIPRMDSVLRKHLGGKAPIRCLDVGASHGWVGKAINKLAVVEEMWCVEPDERLTNPDKAWSWYTTRIENMVLPDARFDLVTLVHTLEHVRSPRLTLCQLNAAMTENGWLYVEVPNLEYIGMDGQLAEFFIDRHLYFFTCDVLQRLLRETGFTVVERIVGSEDVTILARKTTCGGQRIFDNTLALFTKYTHTRKMLNDRVCHNVEWLNKAMEGGDRVVVCGAGRIFDAYVRAGLNVKRLTGVVDLYIPETTVPLIRKHELTPECELVIIMSQAYKEDIKRALKGNHAGKVVMWDDPLTIDK